MRCTLTVVSIGVFLASTASGEGSAENGFGQCILPLGMEEGKIPDDAITASSSYETKSVGPQNARIRQEKNGGAWCPKAQISSAIREYLEIDLTKNHLIAWTETQGRFGNGQGQEYAEAFFLEYWRDTKWHQYKNLRGDKVLRGNSNTYLVEKQKLDLPFVANRVRFVPYSQHPRTVCMRVEIYGCIWEQYVTSYSAPRGSSRGPGGWNVQDLSYDGIEIESRLVNGLGQLTDGVLGELSEILSSSANDHGTNWIGWSEDSIVQIIFHFQELREFKNCSVHVARIPQLEIEIFSTLRVSFSIDGENYESEAEILESSIDTSLTANASTVLMSISLQSRIGRFVKLEFNLAAKWLLLSEITFYSTNRNRSSDLYTTVDQSFPMDRNQSRSAEKTSNSLDSILDFNETELYKIQEDASTPDAFPVGTSQTYIGLVSGALTIFVLLLTCTAFLMKKRGRNKIALLQKHTALLCDSSASAIAITPLAKDVKLSNSIVTGLSLIRKPITIVTSDNLTVRSNTDSQTDPRRSTLYERTYNLFSEENLELNESNTSACAIESRTESDFTLPTTTTYSSRKAFHFQSGKVNQTVHEGYYATTDILTIKKRELLSTLSPFTPLHIREKSVRLPRTIESYDVQRISRHRLRILDKFGEGNFGLVHLCEAKGITSPEMGILQNQQTVIVRSLWRGVVDSLRLDFTKDMHVLAMLRNPNIVKMMALVDEEPFGAVFEYSQFGDLPSFFESHRNSDIEEDISNYGSCLNFVTQIVSGMKYLESMNIAHCDLAARNCIVGNNLTIKVSDHAIYCDKYDHHYFIDGHNAKIPLRWMAWEAVLLGKRSCKADVWSFAITVWEIFLNCKELPYADLTVAQVLENYDRWYRSGKSQPQILSQPDRCPNDLYRVMNKCWSKQNEDRPSFEEIYLYLERLALD
ncbi:discoidin domain-containing receptor tyrosine kinase B [Xylocopa sonorina]|uniref:discoidin domain-containing receptor tyrosine kinase B n=1 Tax=Xylocopa sonorina TaxID=1818115 RepID=UPI00403A9F46